ncbi:MAG: aminotransferase class IV [Bacteroidia bacterium]
MSSFTNFNEKIIAADTPLFKVTNRAFCYGDALFETMRWHDKKILFIEDHLDRLLNGMRFLKMKIPEKFSSTYFQKQISDLVKKNKVIGDARIRLQVYRNEGGYYTPENNLPGFVIVAEKIKKYTNRLSKKGLSVGIYSEIQKSKSRVSNFKTSNSLTYVLAGIFANENNFDDCLILNTDGNIAEAVSSNIFIIKNKIIITPPVIECGVNGVMRKNILRICEKKKTGYSEKPLQMADIFNADEIFLTNVIEGIRWVKKFGAQKYANDATEKLWKMALTGFQY